MRQQPGSSVIRLNLALAYYKQALYDKAEAELREVRRLAPENHQSLQLLADCFLRLGKNREAIALLEPAHNHDEEDEAVTYMLGLALIRDGQIEPGQRIIDRILAMGGTGEPELLMGAAELAASHPGAAIPHLDKALHLNSQLPGIWTLYGRAQMDTGDNPGAQTSFRKALEADANDFDANLNLGALLRHDGDAGAAEPFLSRALALRPTSSAARFQVGATDLALGRLEEARASLEAVAREAPDFQPVHVQLAALYYRMHRQEDGERERRIVLQLNEKERTKQIR